MKRQLPDLPLANAEAAEDAQDRMADLDLCVDRAGRILSIEGYWHMVDRLVGDLLYVPDPVGDRCIFGRQYRKVTVDPLSGLPVPYDLRGSLDSYVKTLPFTRYKTLLSRSELDFCVRTLSSVEMIDDFPKREPVLEQLSFHRSELVAILGRNTADRISIGVAGSLLLGNLATCHDWDFVLHGSVEDLDVAGNALADYAERRPAFRVFADGKSWRQRVYSPSGALLCCFFKYANPELDAPLREGKWTLVATNVTVDAVVESAQHAWYTPTILRAREGAHWIRNYWGELSINGQLDIVAYHTASRGDALSGDCVTAEGDLYTLAAAGYERNILLVLGRSGLLNKTPPWAGFYYGLGRATSERPDH